MKRQHPPLWQWLYRRRRILLYLLSFVVVVAVQTLLYWWGMRTVEGAPRSLLDSLDVIVQSLTTTGYGQDAPWESTFVSLLAIAAQFTGIAYLFVAFPLFVVPWLREMIIEPTVPEAIEDVEDHVLLAGFSPFVAALVDDLEARGRPYVLVESDPELARELYEADRTVIDGDPSDREALQDANVGAATAVVVDTTEADGIATVLAVSEAAPELDVVCLVDDPTESQYLRHAGATTVLSPRHRLGKSLADKARHAVTPELDDGALADVDLVISEFSVADDSELYGQPLTELDELAATGANLVGAWVHGEFVTAFSGDDTVDENTALIVVGTESQLDDVRAVTHTDGYIPNPGPVVIAGYGIAGMTAEGILRKADRDVTVLDDRTDDADVVGDPTDAATLHDAGITDAGTIIVAFADDARAIRTVLVARNVAPDVEIIAAANDVDDTIEFYKAGADYVLAVPKLAARMALLQLLDEAVMALCDRIRVEPVEASAVELDAVDTDELRRRTDCVVVAARRGGELATDVDDGLEPAPGDTLIVAGPAEAVDEFEPTDSG